MGAETVQYGLEFTFNIIIIEHVSTISLEDFLLIVMFPTMICRHYF